MEIISCSVSETLSLGKRIAKNLERGDIVCLFGNLGSGKTVLTKGIASGLGLKKDNIISPTFVLIRQYNELEVPLFHFDLYRLSQPLDIVSLGYEEYFYNEGITVIEWADKLKYLLPPQYLGIQLLVKSESERVLKFKPVGRRYHNLCNLFLKIPAFRQAGV